MKVKIYIQRNCPELFTYVSQNRWASRPILELPYICNQRYFHYTIEELKIFKIKLKYLGTINHPKDLSLLKKRHEELFL